MCYFLCLVYSVLHIHPWYPKWQDLLKQDDIPLYVYTQRHTTQESFTLTLLKGLWSRVEFLFAIS